MWRLYASTEYWPVYRLIDSTDSDSEFEGNQRKEESDYYIIARSLS